MSFFARRVGSFIRNQSHVIGTGRTFYSTGAHKTRLTLWERYNGMLQRGGWQSVALKTATSAVIACVGDISCQILVEGPVVPVDDILELAPQPRQQLKAQHRSQSSIDDMMGALDVFDFEDEPQIADQIWMVSGGFVKHNPYDHIDIGRALRFAILGGISAPMGHFWYAYLGRTFTGTGYFAAVKRVMADQFVYSPPFFALVFSYLALTEGRDWTELQSQLTHDLPHTVCKSWEVWGPCQMVNFMFVPAHLQVLFCNVVGLFWNTYLSWMVHQPRTPTGTATAHTNALVA